MVERPSRASANDSELTLGSCPSTVVAVAGITAVGFELDVDGVGDAASRQVEGPLKQLGYSHKSERDVSGGWHS